MSSLGAGDIKSGPDDPGCAYETEVLTFSDPIFSPRIPVTYLLTLRGSRRRAQYLRQLAHARPTRTVVILHNPGQQCKPSIRTAREDLWHANQEIMRRTAHLDHPVLILEDDVEFVDLPTLRKVAPTIEDALLRTTVKAGKAGKGGCELYFLGCVPLLSYRPPSPPTPSDRDHLRCMLCGSTHAVIYSATARARLRGKALPSWLTHDLLASGLCRSWTWKYPLAVQRHPITNNSREWGRLYRCHWYFRLWRADRDGVNFYRVHHSLGAIGGIVGVAVPVLAVVVLVLILLGMVVLGRVGKAARGTVRGTVQTYVRGSTQLSDVRESGQVQESREVGEVGEVGAKQ